MENNSNKVTARVGFELNDSEGSLSNVLGKLSKLNQEAANTANSFKNAEKSAEQFGNTASTAEEQITNAAKKGSKQRNMLSKDEYNQKKMQRQKDLEDNRKSNQLEIQDNRVKNEKIVQAERRQTESFRTEEQKRRLNNKLTYNQQLFEQNEANRKQRASERALTDALTREYQNRLANYKNTMSQMKKEVNSLSAITNMGTANSGNRLQGQLGHAIANAGLTITGIRAVINQFAYMSRDIVEIEKNVINIQRIMKNNSQQLSDDLFNTAAEIAKNTATQITDVQEIQSAWVRVNAVYSENLELLNKITEASAKFMNVGQIENAEDAVALVNAAMLQFGMVTTNAAGETVVAIDEAINTLNKWAYMADKTALGTADEFGESIRSFGGQITALGGDMDDAIVMTSILADRLAKTGQEAGKSLKTFTSYLTREKTVNLFKELNIESEGLINDLMKTSTQYEEFTVLMKNVSDAYNTALAEGNTVAAKRIQEAVGAVRQGDSAIALLKNWSSDYEKYIGMINEATQTNYLDDQNAKLLESFSAQWSQLKTEMQEFGTSLFNAGIGDHLKGLMDIFGGFLKMITDAPEPIRESVVSLLEMVTALQAIKAIGKLTGISEIFKAGTYGSAEQRVLAEETAKVTSSMFEQELQMRRSKQASLEWANATEEERKKMQQEIAVIEGLQKQFLELTAQYKTGEINAAQYRSALDQLTSSLEKHRYVVEQNTNAQNTNNVTDAQATQVDEVESQAIEHNTQETQENTASIIQNTNAQNANNASNIQEAATEELVTVAIEKQTIAQKALNGVKSVGASLLNTLKSPLTAVFLGYSLLKGAISAINKLFPTHQQQIENARDAYKEANEELANVNSELEDAKEKLDNLRSIEKPTFVEQEDLRRQELLVDSLEKEVALRKEKAALAATEVNDKISKGLNKASIDFSDRYSYGGVEHMGMSKASFNPDEIKAFISEIHKLEDEIETLEAGTEEYLIAQQELADKSQALEYIMGNLRDIFNEQDLSQLTNQNLELYNSFLELESAITGVYDTVADGGNGESDGAVLPELNIEGYTEDVEEYLDVIESIDDAIDKLSSNKYDASDLFEMMQDYEGFSEVVNGTVEEQIEWLRQYRREQTETYQSGLNEARDSIMEQLKHYQNLIDKIAVLNEETGRYEPLIASDENTEKVMEYEEQILSLYSKLEQIEGYSSLEINIETNFGDTLETLDNLITSVDDLVAAQNKLAKGTALSKKELWELAQVYPELMNYAGLFNDTSVQGQYDAIQAILDMKNQEKDAFIDAEILELQAKAEAIRQQILIENEKAQVLNDIKTMENNGKSMQDKEYQDAYQKYLQLESQNYYDVENHKVLTSDDANQEITDNYEAGLSSMELMYHQNADDQAAWSAGGAEAAVTNANAGANGATRALEKTKTIFSKVATWFKNALAGKQPSGSGAQAGESARGKKTTATKTGGNGGGSSSNTYSGSNSLSGGYFDPTKEAEATEFLKKELEKELGNIEAQIGNLQSFKGMDISDLNNTYGGNASSSGGGGGGSKGSSSTGNSKIDNYIKDFESNVEDLLDRIVDALKQKYKEMYNERVQQLKELQAEQTKVHNDRIEQLQAEIDKINGNTTEDKRANLDLLNQQYEQWQADDSTFGKARQNELREQIEELQKEIRIDELEEEISKEEAAIDQINDYFEQLLDANSPLYDPVLKSLDVKMTEQSLYTEASDMIKNQKTDAIIELLSKYEDNFDGMAILMGQTAGDIIANSVKEALANWLDLDQNTITEEGGAHTNAYLAGTTYSGSSSSSTASSSSATSSSASSGSVPFTSKKDSYPKSRLDINGSLIDRLRYHDFDSSFSAREKLYNYWGAPYGAYTGSGKQNSWLLQQMKKSGYSTGTYTGNNEGIAYLHKKERVLNPTQTQAFETLVYDFLPQISSVLSGGNMNGGSVVNNDNSVTFEKEVMSVRIDKVINNTPYDVKNTEDNMNRMFKKAIKQSGLKIKM